MKGIWGYLGITGGRLGVWGGSGEVYCEFSVPYHATTIWRCIFCLGPGPMVPISFPPPPGGAPNTAQKAAVTQAPAIRFGLNRCQITYLFKPDRSSMVSASIY